MPDMLSCTALFLDCKNSYKKLQQLQQHRCVPRVTPADNSTNGSKVPGRRKWEALSGQTMPFSCFISPSFQSTKEMGSNAAQWSSKCFKSVRHPSASAALLQQKNNYAGSPKEKMHIIDATTVEWDINHNADNTSGYKFTSTRNYVCFRERKWPLVYR